MADSWGLTAVLRASFADILFDYPLPFALSFQDELHGVAQGTLTSRVGRDVVGFRLDLGAGIFHGNGQASGAHGGQVDHVVADEGCFLGLKAFLHEDLLEARLLILYTLVY